MRPPERYRRIGRFIRKCRIAKGIHKTAQDLSLKAGLARNYVSVLERGEYHPNWTTIRRIADALALTPSERDELYRLWDPTGKSREIRESTSPTLPAEAVIWKHLPGLLLQVPHTPPADFCSDIDVMVSESVRASGSMLARIALGRAQE